MAKIAVPSLNRTVKQNPAALFIELINFIFVPVRLLIPQPILRKIPLFRTNEDERSLIALSEMSGKALDIGCGNNRVMREYRVSGGEGLGVDVFDWGGPDLVVDNTAQLPFHSGAFDSISFIACLNHIPNRLEVLGEAHRLLKPGGRLLITNLTPLVSALWHRIAFWDADQRVRGMKEGEVWGFTDRELRDMVSKKGFRLTRKRSFMWGLNHLYIFERTNEDSVN
ncbi:MAG: methyltransferase domain-containing protein [Thermodesulfovibrionales bacterium]|jgi:ubiquinone/menaquinone biosynthesis C-methylase UbiE